MKITRVLITSLFFFVPYCMAENIPIDENQEDSIITQFNTLVREYRFFEAQEVLDKAMVDQPQNPIFGLQLVSFRATKRAYIDAQVRVIEAEVTSNPGRALRAAQRILTLQPDHEKARETTKNLAYEVTRRIDPLFAECKVELDKGRSERAREILMEILALDPTDPRVQGLLVRFDESIESIARLRETEIRQVITRLEAHNKSGNHSRTKADAAILQAQLEKSLKEKPGDEKLIALAQQAKSVLNKGSTRTEKIASNKVSDLLTENLKSFTDLFDQAKSRLAEGQFSQAEAIFSQLARSGKVSEVSIAYIYQGIARLAQAQASDVSNFRSQQVKARASFVNGLRFNPKIDLPPGYEQYKKDFNEARQML